MIALFWLFLAVSVSPFKSKNRLAAENAALRHQLIVLQRRVRGRVQLTNGDRLFLVQLYRWFTSVLKAITIIRPETLVRGAPHSGFSALIRQIKARRSAAILGRPPRERDFHRQYRRKPARCERTRVSGRMIVMAFRTDGNHRYRWTKNKRSPFVRWTRPRVFRCNAIS